MLEQLNDIELYYIVAKGFQGLFGLLRGKLWSKISVIGFWNYMEVRYFIYIYNVILSSYRNSLYCKKHLFQSM